MNDDGQGEFDWDAEPDPEPDPEPWFDLKKGMQARDEGLEQVEENALPWFDQAVACVQSMCAVGNGQVFAGENIRYWVREAIGEPHHHNAWGALINTAVRLKIITDTGEEKHMAKPSSHGRRTPLYRWGEP